MPGSTTHSNMNPGMSELEQLRQQLAFYRSAAESRGFSLPE